LDKLIVLDNFSPSIIMIEV